MPFYLVPLRKGALLGVPPIAVLPVVPLDVPIPRLPPVPLLVPAVPASPAVPVGPVGPAAPLGETLLVPLGVLRLAQSLLKPVPVVRPDEVVLVVLVPIVPGGHGAAVEVEAPIELLLMPGPPVLVLPPAVVPCASANTGAVANAMAKTTFLVMSKSPLQEIAAVSAAIFVPDSTTQAGAGSRRAVPQSCSAPS